MKKRLFLIWILIFLLSIFSASAASPFLSNMVHYYTFDNVNSSNPGGNPTMIDAFRTANITSSVNTPTWNLTGQNLQAWDYESTSSEYSIIDSDNAFSTQINTHCIWVKPDTLGLAANRLWNGDDSRTRWSTYLNSNNKANLVYFSSGVNGACTGATALKNTKYYFLCFVYDVSKANEMFVYVNGTQDANCNNAGVLDQPGGTNRLSNLVASYGDGLFDEVMFWSDAKSSTFIQALYNTTLTGNYTWIKGGAPPPPIDDLNLSEITPAPPKAQFNSNPISVWALGNASANWTCRLYINGVVNQTRQLSNGINVNCSFNVTFPNGEWNTSIRGNTTLTDENTSTVTIYFDDISPVITNTNFINNSIFYVGDGNISASWNISDNFYLYAVRSYIDGNLIDNITEINATTYTYNLNTFVTGNSLHRLNLIVSDGHTDNIINSEGYDWSNGLFNDYLEFSFSEPYKQTSINIENKDSSIWDSWKAIEQKDRYSFSFEPGTITDRYILDITSENQIHILKNKDTFTWLVFDNHWIDFAPYQVSFRRITDTYVQATILNPDLHKKLLFESIGDLNLINVSYNFTITNMSVLYSNPVVEGSNQTFILRIYTPGTITSTNASLIWNGTSKTITKTSLASYDRYTANFLMPNIVNFTTINFTWQYNIISPINNLTGNLTYNQTIYPIGIDDCSVYTTRAINFSLMNEINLSLIPGTGTIDTTITAYPVYSNKAVSETFYFSYTGNNTYGLCIYPAWSSYTIDFNYLEYGAAGFETREYEDTGLVINNISQAINLYLLGTNSSSNVIISLRDTDDNKLENYFIEVQRYYPGTGQTITTQIINTDYNGQAIAKLLLNSAEYSFIIKNSLGQIVKTIAAAKIYTTSLTFIVDISETILSFEDKVWYSITPNSPINPQVITFSLITDSPGNYLEWYRIYSSFNGSNYNQNLSNPGGSTAAISINLTNQGGNWIVINYAIKAMNESLLTFSRGYLINNVNPTAFSIESQKTNWENFADELWRVIIAVLVSICAILVFVPFIGSEAAGIIGLLIQIGFTWLGWIPLWMILIEVVLIIGGYLILSRGEI